MPRKNYTPPADDAPAAAWGAFAESIPGWREPYGDRFLEAVRIVYVSPIGDLPPPRYVMDPDHWAWWGWVIHLLQPVGFGAGTDEDGTCGVSLWETDENGNSFEGASINIGRAGIATAAAYGRWPGGGK